MVFLTMHPQLSFESLNTQKEHQTKALQELLAYLNVRSPYYKKLFAQHNIDIKKLKDIDDLQYIPTTDKHVMQEQNWEFLCVERDQVREYTATSGTLGRPVTIALTANDV